MRQKKDHPGFTLIELLVVIAVIALLLSVLVPALRRAKEAGKRAACLANVKSLTAGWLMYIQDNKNQIPKATAGNDGWIRAIPGYIANPEEAPLSLQMEALEQGLLFPYLGTTEVYRCSVARPEEFRTYSSTHAMNGSLLAEDYGGTVMLKYNEIRNTGTRIAFLDDYTSDWDAAWFIYNNREQWWNTTPIRHGAGGNVFSFADGHSEFWGWKDGRTIALAKKCFELNTPEARSYPDSMQSNNEDLIRVQKGVWGKLGY